MMPVSMKMPGNADELLRWAQRECIPLLRQLREAAAGTPRAVKIGSSGVVLGLDATGAQVDDIVVVQFTVACTISPGGAPLPPAAPWAFNTNAPDTDISITAGSRALFQYDGSAWQLLAFPVLK